MKCHIRRTVGSIFWSVVILCFLFLAGIIAFLWYKYRLSMNNPWNWCDALSAITSTVVAAGGLIGGLRTYQKWSDEKAFKRGEDIDKLLMKFSQDEIKNSICCIDSEGGAAEFFSNATPGSDQEKKIESSLMLLSQLCQMKMSNVISEDEFLLFKESVFKVLSDNDVKNYINQAIIDSGVEDGESRFGLLLKFAKKNGIDMSVKAKALNSVKKADSENRKNGIDEYIKYIQKEDFDSPTMIIKINRMYQEGMDINQVYDVVHGWWRLRKETADKVKLVIAVANGIVRGVYKVDRWVVPENSNLIGRIGFKGEPADEEVSKKYMGKSVKNLFVQGAANPVRYFNVK